jgi:hypothetical protein
MQNYEPTWVCRFSSNIRSVSGLEKGNKMKSIGTYMASGWLTEFATDSLRWLDGSSINEKTKISRMCRRRPHSEQQQREGWKKNEPFLEQTHSAVRDYVIILNAEKPTGPNNNKKRGRIKWESGEAAATWFRGFEMTFCAPQHAVPRGCQR